MTEEGISLEDCKYINFHTHNGILKRSQVKEGYLITKITGVGRMAVSSVAPKGFEGNINQHLVAIKTDNSKTSEVLAAFLNSDIGERLAFRRSTGGTRPALDYRALKTIPVIFKHGIVDIMQSAYYQPRFEEVEKALKKGKYGIFPLKETFSTKLVKGILPSSEEKEGSAKVLQIRNIKKEGLIVIDEFITAKRNIFLEQHQLTKGDIIIVITGATIATFFTDTLPAMPALTDYRINRERRLTPQVYIAERRAYYIANKLAELTDKRTQIPDFPEALKPDELAQEFRKYLKVNLLKSKKPEEILTYYKQSLEEKLLISVIELPLRAEDVRGFSVSANVSIAVLNEDDNPSIKLFSLFHEVYHLLKRTSGICSIEIEQKDGDIEASCNSFSAEFLVPLDDLRMEYKKFPQLDESTVSELSKIYGVSKQVIMLRLLWVGYMPKERYEQFTSKREEKIKGKKVARKNWDKIFQNKHILNRFKKLL